MSSNDIVKDYGEEYFKNTGIEYGPDLKLYRAKGCDALLRHRLQRAGWGSMN